MTLIDDESEVKPIQSDQLQHESGSRSYRSSAILDSIKIGLCVFVAWIPLVLILHNLLSRFIPYEHGTLNLLSESGPENKLLIATVAFLTAVLVAPVVEEYLFRGVLQGFLTRLFSAGPLKPKPDRGLSNRPVCWLAIAISSLAFAVIHLGQGAAPISLFVMGLGVGYLYDRTGSLLACIIVHGILNGMTMIFSLVQLFVG